MWLSIILLIAVFPVRAHPMARGLCCDGSSFYALMIIEINPAW